MDFSDRGRLVAETARLGGALLLTSVVGAAQKYIGLPCLRLIISRWVPCREQVLQLADQEIVARVPLLDPLVAKL